MQTLIALMTNDPAGFAALVIVLAVILSILASVAASAFSGASRPASPRAATGDALRTYKRSGLMDAVKPPNLASANVTENYGYGLGAPVGHAPFSLT